MASENSCLLSEKTHSQFISQRQRMIARLQAVAHSHNVHVTCFGECTFEAGGWWCHGCDERVAIQDVVDAEPITVAEAKFILSDFIGDRI